MARTLTFAIAVAAVALGGALTQHIVWLGWLLCAAGAAGATMVARLRRRPIDVAAERVIAAARRFAAARPVGEQVADVLVADLVDQLAAAPPAAAPAPLACGMCGPSGCGRPRESCPFRWSGPRL
jgi:hypothetical protein